MKRILVLLFLFLLGLPAAAQVAIEGVRFRVARDYTRLVFDISAPIEHRIFGLKDPQRLVIDLKNAALAADIPASGTGGPRIKRIRSGVRSGTDLRVVLDLSREVKPKSFLLRPNGKYGHRLVIDVYDRNPDEQSQPVKTLEHPAAHNRETASVASVKPATVESASRKSEPAPAASYKQQQSSAVVALADRGRPGTVDEAVERARLALARGQYQEALGALQTLSPEPEGRSDFWLMKGSAQLGLGQLDAAEKAFESAKLLAPWNAQIVVQQAIVKQEKGDHASALQLLEYAASLDPSAPEVYLNQGYSQLELGAVRDAARSFRIFLRTTEGRSLYAEQRRAVSRWLAQISSDARSAAEADRSAIVSSVASGSLSKHCSVSTIRALPFAKAPPPAAFNSSDRGADVSPVLQGSQIDLVPEPPGVSMISIIDGALFKVLEGWTGWLGLGWAESVAA